MLHGMVFVDGEVWLGGRVKGVGWFNKCGMV